MLREIIFFLQIKKFIGMCLIEKLRAASDVTKKIECILNSDTADMKSAASEAENEEREQENKLEHGNPFFWRRHLIIILKKDNGVFIIFFCLGKRKRNSAVFRPSGGDLARSGAAFLLRVNLHHPKTF